MAPIVSPLVAAVCTQLLSLAPASKEGGGVGGKFRLLSSVLSQASGSVPGNASASQVMLPGSVMSLAIAPLPRADGGGSYEIFAGMKRGTIELLQLKGNDDDILHVSGSVGATSGVGLPPPPSSGEARKSPPSALPIYSLAFDTDCSHLFAGGGDRYVSVWKRPEMHDHGGCTRWMRTQRLGPHTGWVKDILFAAGDEQLVRSIGCNCIETWSKATGGDNDDESNWTHNSKVSLESSPALGSTLSSDLLCLCQYQHGMFFAGGVDGRINLWGSSSSGARKETIVATVAAHGGRVNALVYEPRHGVLFSGSHDGTVKCWSVRSFADDKGAVPSISLISEVLAGEGVRITSLACWPSTRWVSVFYGTQKGTVGVATYNVEDDGEAGRISSLEGIDTTALKLPGDPSTNALSVFPSATSSSRCRILVGHFFGASLLEYCVL